MTDKQYYKERFNLQLRELSRFPVWTRDQIKVYLHLSNDTLINLEKENIIYKFNISRCTFYSIKNKKYTNNIIIKSILEIDSYYRVHYDEIANFRFDDKLEDKSLISRNVKKIGTNEKIDYFSIFNINPETKFEKIIDLMIDIENLNDKPCLIMIYVYNVDKQKLTDYIEENYKIIPYLMEGRLEYLIIECDYPHFKYLQL